MLTITAEAFHEKISVRDDEIILIGPPNNLRGHIFIRNTDTEALRVKSLPLLHDNQTGRMTNESTQLRLSCRLQPGEEKLEPLFHQVSPQTPPGNYMTTLQVGGQMRQLQLMVQARIDINVYPQNFSFQETGPGKIHTAEFALTNIGNVPFQVPEVKHIAALDMDFFCRAFGFGFRDKGAEGHVAALDEVTRNIQSNIPDWAPANIKEVGKILVPGESMIIHLSITLPANSDPRKDYSGNIRFWNKDIAFAIKSYNEKQKKQST